MENSSRNFTEIFIFGVVIQAVLLENSSIFFRNFNSGASWQTVLLKNLSTFGLDEFSSKTAFVTPQNINFEKIGLVFQ